MHDNFSKALNQFITKQIVADHDQMASFEQIREKLEQEQVDLSEVCCDLIKWAQSFTKDYHTHELQFDFEGNRDAEETLRNILIQYIPDAYYAVYVYVELEEYKKLAQKKLHNNVIDEIQSKVLEKELPDFLAYVREVVNLTGEKDRHGRIALGSEEIDLLESLSSVVRQYVKAAYSVTPITKFFAEKNHAERVEAAPERLETMKLFA